MSYEPNVMFSDFPSSWFRVPDAPEAADGTNPSEERPSPPRVRAHEGRDLLTCGQCSRAFPLAHILAFIQHKQGGCRSGNQAPDANAPPSPASRARQNVAGAELGPGFIELRRGGGAWGEEPNVRVKAEPSKTGEERGSLLIRDSDF